MENTRKYSYISEDKKTIFKAVKSCPILNFDHSNSVCERGIACPYEHGSDYQLKESPTGLGYGEWKRYYAWDFGEEPNIPKKRLDKFTIIQHERNNKYDEKVAPFTWWYEKNLFRIQHQTAERIEEFPTSYDEELKQLETEMLENIEKSNFKEAVTVHAELQCPLCKKNFQYAEINQSPYVYNSHQLLIEHLIIFHNIPSVKYNKPLLIKFVRHRDTKINCKNYYIIRDIVNGKKFFLLCFFLKDDKTISIQLSYLFNDDLDKEIIFSLQNINENNEVHYVQLSNCQSPFEAQFHVKYDELALFFIGEKSLNYEKKFNYVQSDCPLCAEGHDFVNCSYWSLENFNGIYRELTAQDKSQKKQKIKKRNFVNVLYYNQYCRQKEMIRIMKDYRGKYWKSVKEELKIQGLVILILKTDLKK